MHFPPLFIMQAGTEVIPPNPSPPSTTPTIQPQVPRPSLDPGISIPWGFLSQDIIIFFLVLYGLFRQNILGGANLGRFKRLLDRDYEYNKQIDSILYRIQGITDADRVLLGLFHNGDTYSTGHHPVKMTVTNEATHISILPIKNKVKNILLHSIKNELLILKENPDNWVTVYMEQPGLDIACRNHLMLVGARSMSNILLLYKGIEIGVLSIQVCTETVRDSKKIIEEHKVALDFLVDLLIAVLTKTKDNIMVKLWDATISKNKE